MSCCHELLHTLVCLHLSELLLEVSPRSGLLSALFILLTLHVSGKGVQWPHMTRLFRNSKRTFQSFFISCTTVLTHQECSILCCCLCCVLCCCLCTAVYALLSMLYTLLKCCILCYVSCASLVCLHLSELLLGVSPRSGFCVPE